MAAPPELALLAEFDDIVRSISAQNQFYEKDWLQFLDSTEYCLQQWGQSENSVKKLTSRVEELESDVALLRTKLEHARSQIDYEMEVRQKSEKARDALENQLRSISEILLNKKPDNGLTQEERNRLTFLTTRQSHPPKMRRVDTMETSESLLNASDCSFEDRDDSIYNFRNTRRSRSQGQLQASENRPPLIPGMRQPPSTRPRKSAGARRRSSRLAALNPIADNLNEDYNSPVRAVPTAPAPPVNHVEYTPQKPPRQPELYVQLQDPDTPSSLTKAHRFASKNMLKMEDCAVCSKRLTFVNKALRCMECKAIVHPECEGQMRKPCILTGPTTPSGKVFMSEISDFVGEQAPFVPGIIVNCVMELERRGLHEPGLYRVSGSDKEVRELRDKFYNGKAGVAVLNGIRDDHVLVGCIKSFLKDLKSSLLPSSEWETFKEAAESQSVSALTNALVGLPYPNQHTLAYLMIHFAKVLSTPVAEGGRLTIEGLAKILGPTLVSGSGSLVSPSAAKQWEENHVQQRIVHFCLSQPVEFWRGILVGGGGERTMQIGLTGRQSPITPMGAMASPRTEPRSFLHPIARRQVGTTNLVNEGFFSEPRPPVIPGQVTVVSWSTNLNSNQPSKTVKRKNVLGDIM